MAITQISLPNGIQVISAVLCAVVAWVWWSVLEWVWFRPKRVERMLNQQGIHGNPYRLFHGDTREIKALRARSMSEPMETLSHDFFPRVRPFLHRSMELYGKNCLMWDGPVPVVNIAESGMVREVFSRYNDFQKARDNPVTDLLVRGLISYEGSKWAQRRKLLNPAFHIHKIKLMLPAFYTSCIEMVNLWEHKLSNSEQEIDVCDDLTSLSADTISRTAFGSSYEEGKRIFKLIREQLLAASEISQSVYVPGSRFFPSKKFKKMKRIEEEIKTLITGIIEKRKGVEETDDLLGMLLESNSESNKNRNGRYRVTTEEVIDECKLFYLAGQETTSNLLIWTMILLSKHQDWQSRARDEILEAFGQERPDFEGLNNLKTVNIIFQEVMRLYPPLMELRRKVAGDNTKLGNLTLPAGTIINLPILYTHNDREVWGEDAEFFNPERFSQGISKAARGTASFLAFGGGPRVCIGSNFAMIEAKLALSLILQRFRFKISPTYVHAPIFYGLLHPQFGAPIVFHHM